jgi:mannose-6-phosphate isomerase
LADGDQRELVTCPYFRLQLLAGQSNSIELETGGESFHVLTLIEGQAQVEGADWGLELDRFGTVVIPAACDPYRIQPQGFFRALQASV